MEVKYVDLGAQWHSIRARALPLIDEVLKSGNYLEHEVVTQLEKSLSDFLQIGHVVTLNSGTDALLMSLKVLGIGKGDEVISVPNSFIATAAAIEHIGAKIIFVDVGPDHLIDVKEIEKHIGPKTRAILPVHLEGKMADMPSIRAIADNYNLVIIEDAAQSIGTTIGGKHPGHYSDVACFSLHPLKNLNGLGDGGFVATNKSEIATRISQLRNHGQVARNSSHEFGFVSRLDSINAAVLLVKLVDLPSVLERRREIAAIYDAAFQDSNIKTPVTSADVSHSYHLYVVEVDKRDLVQKFLTERSIETKIHYPTLIPDQMAYTSTYGNYAKSLTKSREQVSRILSLPIHQHLTNDQISFVCDTLREFQ